jgi:hypothetical protein
MSTYDEYGSVQLKVGLCEMLDYSVGDKAGIPDGVYVGHDGVVVIKDGVFIAEFSHLVTTWGDIVKPETVLSHTTQLHRQWRTLEETLQGKYAHPRTCR